MGTRYDIDPSRLRGQKDIIEYVKNILQRVSEQDTSLQIGHTAVEDGDLSVINGDILVKEPDGTVVLRLMHGAVPEIRMFPLGETDSHQIALYGFDFDVGLGVDQGFQIGVETTTEFQDGGKLLLTKHNAIVGHQPQFGQETFIWLNADNTLDEVIRFRGFFRNKFQYDDHQAVYAGSDTVSSGVSTYTHSYASSFSGTVIPIVTVDHGATGTTLQWNTDSYGASSFTVRFSSTTFGKTVNYWVVKIT